MSWDQKPDLHIFSFHIFGSLKETLNVLYLFVKRCLLFNDILTFSGYVIPNPSFFFYKDSSGTI